MSCRICLEPGGITPCLCAGTMGHVHEKCLRQWIRQSGNMHCELCKATYHTKVACAYRPCLCLKRTLLLRNSLYKRVDALIFLIQLSQMVGIFTLMPIPQYWLLVASILTTLNTFLAAGVATCGACPFQTLFTTQFFTSVGIVGEYFIRKHDYSDMCGGYFMQPGHICRKSVDQMEEAMSIQIMMLVLFFIMRQTIVVIRSCRRVKILSLEETSLLTEIPDHVLGDNVERSDDPEKGFTDEA